MVKSSRTLMVGSSRVSACVLTLIPTLSMAAGNARAPADTLMPLIVHEACSAYEKGKSFTILARFDDESQLFDPKVIYRSRGDTDWKHVGFEKVPRSETFRAVIDFRELRGPLEYFIEVFDEYGNGPARIGRPDAPVRVVPARSPPQCQQVPVAAAIAVTSGSRPTTIDEKVPPPPKGACELDDPPLYCSTWLWITVGTLAVAGAATAVYFAIAPDHSGGQTSSVTITLTGPNPTLTP